MITLLRIQPSSGIENNCAATVASYAVADLSTPSLNSFPLRLDGIVASFPTKASSSMTNLLELIS